MSDWPELYEAVRALRGQRLEHGMPNAAIDELALATAGLMRDHLAANLKISLPWQEWVRLLSLLQVDIVRTLRHVVLDPSPFPGLKR